MARGATRYPAQTGVRAPRSPTKTRCACREQSLRIRPIGRGNNWANQVTQRAALARDQCAGLSTATDWGWIVVHRQRDYFNPTIQECRREIQNHTCIGNLNDFASDLHGVAPQYVGRSSNGRGVHFGRNVLQHSRRLHHLAQERLEQEQCTQGRAVVASTAPDCSQACTMYSVSLLVWKTWPAALGGAVAGALLWPG